MKKTLLTKGRKRVCFPPKIVLNLPYHVKINSFKRKPFFHLPTTYVGYAKYGFVQHVKLVEGTDVKVLHHRSGRAFSVIFSDTHVVEQALLWAKSKYCTGVRKVNNPICGGKPLLLPEGHSIYKMILKAPELKAYHSTLILAKDVTIQSVLGEVENCEVIIPVPRPFYWLQNPDMDSVRRIDLADGGKQFEIVKPSAGKIFACPHTIVGEPNANDRIYAEGFNDICDRQLLGRLKRGPLSGSLEHPTP